MAILMEREINMENEVDALFRHYNKQPIDNDVGVILLRQHHDAFGSKEKSWDTAIWGKTVKQWVEMAFDTCPIMELDYREGVDVLNIVKPYLSDKKYTAVFWADTPLFRRETFLSILDYVQTKRLNVCKLERGYIFVTEYLRNVDKVYSTVYPNMVSEQEFRIAKDMKSMEEIGEVLKKRILDFHVQQGVHFVDKASVNIDADVVIGEGVVVHGNNTIEGASIIADNVVLYTGNIITDSKIGEGCVLKYSVIEDSDIPAGTEVLPFSYIQKGVVKR
ncbi:MAG: hypothetical protein IKC79_01200 [Clostridia bacterium]|nr:hypothetical protein [Clostridia bacterium]